MHLVFMLQSRARGRARAFTLIELLVVIAIIVILAGMFSPALAKAKGKAHRVVCTSQLKQLSLCWVMYAQDHHGVLPESYAFDPAGGINEYAWIRGSMDDNPAYGQLEPGKLDSTNVNAIIQGKLFPYNRSTAIYRCPTDRSTTGTVPRVRSYSINGWMGGRPLAGQDEYRVFLKETDLTDPGPAQTFVFIDEHEKSINDGWFVFDMTGARGLIDAPATRHDHAFTLSFADGHVETWKLKDARTINWQKLPISNQPDNPDWQRLRAAASSAK
jgi:prepilin-type N-terminal cleavage/methylation domain-containing protein/prepilin-type processing-associated H-X9-DG protein